MTNAIKFTRRGYITVTGFLVYRVDGTPLIQVRVTDEGIGMSPTEMCHIFEGLRES